MLSFAFKTLIADRGKLLTGLAGVFFSLVLINIQGGLYFGQSNKASLLVERCEADLWVAHRGISNVDLARDIPELWINRIRGLSEVESARPCIVGKGTAALAGGRTEEVRVIGVDPATMCGGWEFAEGSASDLGRPAAVSFDEVDFEKLGRPQVGDRLEVNGRRARFIAKTRGVNGFMNTPYLMTTLETARHLSNVVPGGCSYILVKVRPGEDVSAVRAAIQTRVPGAAVLTSSEFAAGSREYWMNRSGIGIGFGASTLLGLLVGATMIGQSLYSIALDHLHDYATLKALGAEDRHVFRVIAVQSLLIAGVGSVAGMFAVALLNAFWSSVKAPIEIPFALVAVGVAFVFVICLAASLLPCLRLRRIDTALVLSG